MSSVYTDLFSVCSVSTQCYVANTMSMALQYLSNIVLDRSVNLPMVIKDCHINENCETLCEHVATLDLILR